MSREILYQNESNPEIGCAALHPHYVHLLTKLNDENIPFVIIGALAVALTGYNRLTRDIDAVCRDLHAMIIELYAAGFRIVSHAIKSEPGAFVVFADPKSAEDSLRKTGKPSMKSIHFESRLEFDVWFSSPEPGAISIDDIERESVNVVISGVPIRRACAEHLITLKKIAIAEDPSRIATDGSDIAYLETYLKNHGAERNP